MRLTIEIPEIDRVNVNLLKERGVDIDAVCRDAIVNKVRELDLQRQFVIGDEIRINASPQYYGGHHGTVVGYHRSYVTVRLTNRTVAMFGTEELKHRDA